MFNTLTLNYSKFDNYFHFIYPIEFWINGITYTARPASYIQLQLEIDSEIFHLSIHPIFGFPIVISCYKRIQWTKGS
jgi:hypothetical protein